MSQGYALLILGSKGQGHNALIIEKDDMATKLLSLYT